MDIMGPNLQGLRGIVLLERIDDDGGAADIASSTSAAILEDVLQALRNKIGDSSGAVACTSSSGVEIR